MSHQPPVPEAARSPYPLQPAPIPDDWPADQQAGASDDRAEDASAAKPREWPGLRSQIGIGAAIGIGSAALVAALLYQSRADRPATGAPDRRARAARSRTANSAQG